MPVEIVLRNNAAVARQQSAANELAMANTRAQMARSGASYPAFKPDPNSEFMRKMKAATLERAIQDLEAQKRADSGESIRSYSNILLTSCRFFCGVCPYGNV